MKTQLLNTIALLMMIPLFTMATPTNTQEVIELTVSPEGHILQQTTTTWTNGNINQFYLDFAHTQRTFNNIQLVPGNYRWDVQLRMNNGKKGKFNFDVYGKFQTGSNSTLVDRKLETNRNHTGTFSVSDYKSRSSGAQAGYGKVKVHVGRAGINTNCNYKITLTRTGGSAGYNANAGNNNGGNNNGYGNSGNNNNADTGGCLKTNIGSKTGTVYGNTRGKLISTEKACKNTATVKVRKTGGKARTTVLVYKSTQANGLGTLVDSKEFARNCSNRTETIRVPNANGYFIRVEIKGRSAARSLSYSASITQQ